MTTSFKINVRDSFHLSTRPNGIEARKYVLAALKEHDVVELDFQNTHPSPSFADECVGILCATIGWTAFRTRIRLMNIPDDSRDLFRHIVAKRRSQVVA
ncbi:STAS-like domain-containing protein [Burkholderia pseudomallei]|uniref:STAS-like domain-containing protein n=1 Tax=Burkholderia pseudomallei TaxID=28450 RepID=UPI0018AD01FB